MVVGLRIEMTTGKEFFILYSIKLLQTCNS